LAQRLQPRSLRKLERFIRQALVKKEHYMRRAGIFTVLALLLFAVAGVTFAQEGTFKGNQQDGGATKSASPDHNSSTQPESNVTEQTSKLPNDKNRSLKEDNKESVQPAKAKGLSQARAADGPKPQEERENTAEKAIERTGDELEAKDEPQSNTGAKDKAEGKAKGNADVKAKGKAEGKAKGKSQSQGEDENETGSRRGQQKVTLCHKGKNTITVGAPAEAAHLHHGDEPAAC
jgi:hypothetical protein